MFNVMMRGRREEMEGELLRVRTLQEHKKKMSIEEKDTSDQSSLPFVSRETNLKMCSLNPLLQGYESERFRRLCGVCCEKAMAAPLVFLFICRV